MECLKRFNRKMQISGGSLRGEAIQNSTELFGETFGDDASFNSEYYLWELGIESYDKKEQIPIRTYERKFSAANGTTVKFQIPKEYSIIIGDIVYDRKHNEYFICRELYDIHGIHYQGKMTLCNWMLKWQKKDGTILEYPCYDINSTQYNSGETSNRLMTIGTSQHMIELPSDENTLILKSPQRFYLDKDTENPTTYKVSQNDSVSLNYGAKGIVRLTVMECPASKYDRPDLGICDYISIAEEHNVSNAKIIYNTNIIKSGGDFQTFYAKFFDGNGNEIVDVVPIWNVICDFKDHLKINQLNDYIQISIDDDDYIDEEFKLSLSNSTGDYSSSLIIKIESLL